MNGPRMLDALDDVIHQKVRLGVMSCLMASGEADFNSLKDALGVSDGNLSTHLTVLEESGYITVRKEFVGKKPRTTYTPTDSGKRAFEAYVEALEALVRGDESAAPSAADPTPARNPERVYPALRPRTT